METRKMWHIIEDWNKMTYNVKLLPNNRKRKNSLEPLRERTIGTPYIYGLTNPLIVMIGIGKYHDKIKTGLNLNDISDVACNNYQNVKIAFNSTRGYDMIYCVNEESVKQQKGSKLKQEHATLFNIEYLQDDANLEKTKSKNRECLTNWKLEWTDDEIDELCYSIHDICSYKNSNSLCDFDVRPYHHDSNYNGLIFIISCHGGYTGEEDIIYDSFGNEYLVSNIFDIFDNRNCKSLQDLPKIFILDFERGNTVNKQSNDNNNNNNKNNEKKQSDCVTTQTRNIDKNINGSDDDHENKQDIKTDDELNSDDMFTIACRKIYATQQGYNLAQFHASEGTALVSSVCKGVSNLKDQEWDDIVSDITKYFEHVVSNSKEKQEIVDINGIHFDVILTTTSKIKD